ncbi:uncharacterized protein LOC100822318 [Brachypodium distachyon]|uniref:DUF4220 domain-containing protein n=1 Tax=Brachypodium distachyon TaxID=15368 RepID=I1HI35_BRADI|nr:uncharacterized protein LOC100822318 [Brachypodium distachyon]KQK05609.1 hypothetical protein BRADI_2g21170v3 [Brachypodium distachyon]|eukprot:XP_024315583.1 uncharacterized protein LOC100822318 [Brachypodium distachyon]
MGFSPPVPQQDSNWEIRLAVLISLLLQVLLIFVAPVRRRSSSSVPRFIVWSCYLLADWVADLALGLLLNNLGNIGGGSSTAVGETSVESGTTSPIIFAFWAPFLLLHLGGPDTITSYSLADNELWIRHLVGLLFELTAAAIIFFCALRGNPMILATVLMFVVGIVKYGERTYSLYFASVEPDPGPEYANRRIDIFGGPQGTRRRHGSFEDLDKMSVEAQGYEFFRIFRFLYVNLILSFVSERRISHAFFLSRADSREAFEVVEAELHFLYDVKYTKAPVIHTRTGYALRFLCSCCLAASLLLFVRIDKRGVILPVDVGITYALLVGAVLLDAAALAMLVASNWTMVFLEGSGRFAWLVGAARRLWRPRRRWSETITQMNLISYSLGRPEKGRGFLSPRLLRRVVNAADLLRVRVIIEDFIFVKREPLSCSSNGGQKYIFDFVFRRLKEMASKFGSVEEIRKACELRGTGIIDRKLGEQGSMIIRNSVSRDFDESVLLWHVATHLCLAEDRAAVITHSSTTTARERLVDRKRISRCLSEYMLYLLIKQSDMLSAVAGIGLIRYRDTCSEARLFFESIDVSRWHFLGDEEACRILLSSVNQATEDVEKPSTGVKDKEEDTDESRSVLLDALMLAAELNKLDEETRWQVVAGVWGEMLTFVACRGRGNTHVQQLSHGGELVTMVSFLMNHLGLGNMF